MKLNLNRIYPLIVPASYYSKRTWDLPHYPLPNPSFILTWVIFDSESTMVYLTREQYQYLASNQQQWQRASFENLRKTEYFFTQYKISPDGQRLIFLSFLNNDGIGSSRILLSAELATAFPNGYYVCFPDRSCGLVIPKDITDPEFNDMTKLIDNMFQGATTPMSGKLHPPGDFALPSQWTRPINLELSNNLTNEVFTLRSRPS